MLLAPAIGLSFSLWTVLALLPLMALLGISIGSLGILLATRIRSMEAFQAVTQMLLFPMVFLSGVFFPVQNLPSWMNFLVKVNPVTYGIAPIRQIVLGAVAEPSYGISIFGHAMSIWNNITVLACFGIAMIAMAMWSFSSQE